MLNTGFIWQNPPYRGFIGFYLDILGVYLGISGDVWGYLGMSGDIWGYLGILGVIWG